MKANSPKHRCPALRCNCNVNTMSNYDINESTPCTKSLCRHLLFLVLSPMPYSHFSKLLQLLLMIDQPD